MKNLSLALNVLLIAAVGYLYYHTFSGGSGKAKSPAGDKSAFTDSNSKMAPIAYIELDSLNENISYIRDRRKELEAEQLSIETEWENGYKNLQAQKDNFLKRGAAITQEDAEKFQGQLMEQQQSIDGKKQSRGQALNQKSITIMDNIQKQLKEFLAEYNKDRKFLYILTTGTGQDYMAYKDPALNITNDVIRGMNEKMKSLPK